MLAAYREYGMSAAIWDYQAEAGLHAMRLILSGTLDRNPGLTIVLGHLGEGLPYWLRRIDNRHAFAQRVAGTAAPMPRLDLTPSGYFRRNFAITTSGIDADRRPARQHQPSHRRAGIRTPVTNSPSQRPRG